MLVYHSYFPVLHLLLFPYLNSLSSLPVRPVTSSTLTGAQRYKCSAVSGTSFGEVECCPIVLSMRDTWMHRGASVKTGRQERNGEIKEGRREKGMSYVKGGVR